MKKLFKIFILLLISPNLLFAANHLESNYYCSVKHTSDRYSYLIDLRFKNDKYDMTVDDTDYIKFFTIPQDKLCDGYYPEEGTYEIKEEAGLETIYFNSDSDFTVMKKMGILNYGKLLYLISTDLFIDSFYAIKEPRTSPFMEEYTINTSSFLTEKDLKYDGTTFYYQDHNLIPWVEGVKGDGKGEWIEFDFSSTHSKFYPSCIMDSFLISNGYVNYDKPYLYKANNRAKTLRIVCEERDIDMTVELEDTSRFQLITLPKNLGDKPCKVRFIIESVYKGNKWDDTVINRIIPISKDYIFKER